MKKLSKMTIKEFIEQQYKIVEQHQFNYLRKNGRVDVLMSLEHEFLGRVQKKEPKLRFKN